MIRYLTVTLLLAYAAPAAPAQTRLYSFGGEGILDALGTSVAGLGDLNGDGCDDFAIGAVQSMRFQQAGFVRVCSGKSGRTLFVLRGDQAGDGFGVSVRGAGDVDRDGVPDILVGATPTESTSIPGYVRVFSGKDASILHTLRGGSAGEWFGVSVAGVDDVDGDGHADFAVGAPFWDSTIPNVGVVRVYSGKTGASIHEIAGSASDDYFGFAIAAAGDVDRDGTTDLIVGAYRNDTVAPDAGLAAIYSGKTARLVRTFAGNGLVGGFGFSVAGAGDIDKDSYPDLLVGALWEDPAATDTGSVWVFSGKSGLPLQRLGGNSAYDGMGTSVAGVGDFDGDGWNDVAGGAVQAFPPGRRGYARVWSGRDGSVLETFYGLHAGDWFGYAVAAAGDVNADGHPDVIVGASRATDRVALSGHVSVFGGSYAAALTASPDALSLAAGGVQVLQLDARAVHAGKLYWVLGTAGATTPGLGLDRVRLPLTIDEYFLITTVSPNTPLLRLTLSTLNANGQAFAFFVLPRGLPPTLSGLTLQHSFVVVDPQNFGVDFASNAKLLRITR